MPKIHILSAGYRGGGKTASTVSLIESGDSIIVVDPGMVGARSMITRPLADLGHHVEDVTDVIISHHHPDHTVNIGLFPNARVHDHWAIYKDDIWTSRPAEGFEVADGVTLWETPGHTPQDITTIVDESGRTTAFTHLWWEKTGPAVDPFATDIEALHEGRERVLKIASLIVPGHDAEFEPGPETPR